MKTNFTLFLIACFSILLPAQTKLIIQPNAAAGKDAHIAVSSNGNEGGGAGNATTLLNSAWTQSGIPWTHRSMVEFDLSLLPNDAIIINATLSLYAYDGPETHSQTSGSNACWIERITSNWDEASVKWSNQPSTTTTNRVAIPATSDVTKDYDLDVTNLVQDMADNPMNSFGFLLKLQNEAHFRRMTFCTSDHIDPAKHPKLVIIYQETTAQITLQPNAAEGKDSHIAVSSNGNEGGGAGNATTLLNSAWTQSGTPWTHRSMVEFDLSNLPSNITILDAKLNLYAYDGPETHSQTSGSNTCWVERITSTWDEDGVRWSNQPTTTTANRVAIPATSDVTKDYELDVTNMVQDMADDPMNSFGFLLKLQNENFYRRMTFCTSDHADATKHPSLSISYMTVDVDCVEEKIFVGGSPMGAYTAKEMITTTETVEVSENATFIAPVITLKSGFHAKTGSTLLVQSGENCMPNPFAPSLPSTERSAEEQLLTLNSTEQLESSILSIAPNPFKGEITVTFSLAAAATHGQLAVFTSNGQLIQTIFERKSLEKGIHNYSFRPASREKGMFYFVLRTDKEVLVTKGIAH